LASEKIARAISLSKKQRRALKNQTPKLTDRLFINIILRTRAYSAFSYLVKIINDSIIEEKNLKLTIQKLKIKKWYRRPELNSYYRDLEQLITSNLKIPEFRKLLQKEDYLKEKFVIISTIPVVVFII